ncbi:hypothetical protein H2200_001905 [Cladophialophora chaetospira]|uniref:Uncharacterized protein n=1 Tax=Cladophialophora chaetospira TaxID=386627 RepID=A0AA38XLW0_9EURO|nr:hypothetical protein H2200_001905 [Cladophialophora chaetospira]
MRPLFSQGIASTRLARTNVLWPSPYRSSWLQRSQHTESRLPRIAQPSFWDSIIPRSLRARSSKKGTPASKKPSNPATYFIWIYILIGSQAIRIMGLKSEFMTYSRKADLKIQQLREVVAKLQRGEDVDVEKILGTGDETQEREWEEAMEELQREDRVWQSSREKACEDQARLAKEEQDANPVNEGQNTIQALDPVPLIPQPAGARRPGFY